MYGTHGNKKDISPTSDSVSGHHVVCQRRQDVQRMAKIWVIMMQRGSKWTRVVWGEVRQCWWCWWWWWWCGMHAKDSACTQYTHTLRANGCWPYLVVNTRASTQNWRMTSSPRDQDFFGPDSMAAVVVVLHIAISSGDQLIAWGTFWLRAALWWGLLRDALEILPSSV